MKNRKFLIWAEVRESEVVIELPDDMTDEECESECADALNTLIGNGDTGWNEILEDGEEV